MLPLVYHLRIDDYVLFRGLRMVMLVNDDVCLFVMDFESARISKNARIRQRDGIRTRKRH